MISFPEYLRMRLRHWLNKPTDDELSESQPDDELSESQPDVLKSNPAGTIINIDQGDDGVQQPPYYRQLHARIYETNIWAYAAIKAIGQTVALIPRRVETERTVDGERQWVEIPEESNNPLSALIKRPNPQTSMNSLMMRLTFALEATGEAYCVYDDKLNELWFIRPDFCMTHTYPNGDIKYYRIRRNIAFVNIPPENMIHFRLPSIGDDYYGQPPGLPMRYANIIKRYMEQYIAAYFENDATPGAVLSTPGALTPDQRAVMRKEVESMHRGADQKFRLAILEGGLTFSQMSNALRDLIPTEISDMIREETLAAYNVPPVIIGILKDASYANADMQKRLYYANAVAPICTIIEDEFNIKLSERFGNKLRINLDIESLPEMQENETEKSTRLIGYVNTGIITRNEARKEIGYEPVEDDFANELGGSRLSSFLTGNDPQQQDGTINDQGNDPANENAERIVTHRGMAFIVKGTRCRVAGWKSYQDLVDVAEVSILRMIKQYIDEQTDRVIAGVNDITFGGKMDRTALYVFTKIDDPDNAANAIFDRDEERRALHAKYDGVLKRMIELAAMDAMVSRAGMFNIDADAIKKILKEHHESIDTINDYTFKRLKSLIAEVYAEGLGADEAVRRIREIYTMFGKERALTIARTESTGVIGIGNLLGADEGGKTRKEWVSAFLPTSRDSHMQADTDGQVLPLDGLFIVGGERLRYPGDPLASPGNRVNCYCSMITF